MGNMKIWLVGLLLLVLPVLRLAHLIAWSWWWVTAPAWGLPLLWLAFVIVFAAINVAIGRRRV